MTIYLTDKEIAAELGLKAEKWDSVAAVLERSGLPPRDPLFDERRCWPAVLEFLMRRAGVSGNNTATAAQNGVRYNGFKSKTARANPADKQSNRESAEILEMQRRSSLDGVRAPACAPSRD